MLSKGALNPADITVLFKMFSSMDPPPVELVRTKSFFFFFLNLFRQKKNHDQLGKTDDCWSFPAFRSESLLFWTCSCSHSLSQGQRSTKTINTNTSTSWPTQQVWWRHGKRYRTKRNTWIMITPHQCLRLHFQTFVTCFNCRTSE